MLRKIVTFYILHIVRKLPMSLVNLSEQEAWGFEPLCLSLTLPYFSPAFLIRFVSEILSAVNRWRPGISSVCPIPIVFLTYLQLATIRVMTLSWYNLLSDLAQTVLWSRGNYTARWTRIGIRKAVSKSTLKVQLLKLAPHYELCAYINIKHCSVFQTGY